MSQSNDIGDNNSNNSNNSISGNSISGNSISGNSISNNSNNDGISGNSISNNSNNDGISNNINTTNHNSNTYTLNETIDASGVQVINQQGTDVSNNEFTHTTLTTIDPSNNIQVTEDLIETIGVYDDDSLVSDPNNSLIVQITECANQIKCSDFHGKGSIDDYTALFNAASKIANESQQMKLDVDIDGFTEFGKAADDLSKLFTSFIVKLQNVNIIDDTLFLTAVLSALKKIVNLSNVFGKFKETIIVTTKIQMPKSAHDTSVIINNVMSEVNCAMNCISYFVNPVTDNIPDGVQLNKEEQNVIITAVKTIDNWNILCEQGISIAMSNNTDVQSINSANNSLSKSAAQLTILTATLKNKLSAFNLC
jgi:hypothetical protein